MNAAHDIFEKWDGKLSQGEAMSHTAFERDFKKELGLNYQGLKSVLLAFYRNDQWLDVCEAYVDSLAPNTPIELMPIARRER